MRALMFLAAVVVAGSWIAVRHLPQREAAADTVVKQVRAQEIQSVSIDQAHSNSADRRVPLAELRAVLTSKPGELLEPAKLEADRKALQDALAARGFLAAEVAPASVTFTKNGGAYVVFDLERGPMFHLRSIKVTGPGALDASAVLTLSAGDDVNLGRLERARATLAGVLARRSSNAHVELVVREDRASASADIELATTEVTVLHQPLARPAAAR